MNKNILIILIFLSGLCTGQNKEEYEIRVSEDQMPEKARSLIEEFKPKLRSIRYYSEKDGSHLSYEIKFRYHGKSYSVEFNPEGELEDVEIEHPKRDIDHPARDRIRDHLDNNYDRWRLEKIQFQYLPGDSDKQLLERLFKRKIPMPDMLEIIVWGKKGGEKKSFEMLFKPDGTFVKQREVIYSDHDFLSF